MSFNDKMKEFGSGGMIFLSENGECVRFMVAGEPELFESEFKGNKTRKLGIPIVTLEGLAILIAGMRLGRKIAKHEAEFYDTVFMVIRHGEEGDSDSTYELQVLEDIALLDRLRTISLEANTPEKLAAAFKAARAVCEK